MKKIFIITMSLITLPLTAVISGNYLLYELPHLSIELQLLGKNIQNPELDAANDIANGEIFCFSINGFVAYFPGLESENDMKVCSSASEVNFTATSDGVEGEKHADAIIKAEEYAAKYNQYVARYFKMLK